MYRSSFPHTLPYFIVPSFSSFHTFFLLLTRWNDLFPSLVHILSFIQPLAVSSFSLFLTATRYPRSSFDRLSFFNVHVVPTPTDLRAQSFFSLLVLSQYRISFLLSLSPFVFSQYTCVLLYVPRNNSVPPYLCRS